MRFLTLSLVAKLLHAPSSGFLCVKYRLLKIRIGICVLVNIYNKRVFKLANVVYSTVHISVTLIPEIFFLQIVEIDIHTF